MNSTSMLRDDDVPAITNATAIEALIDNVNNGHDLAERMFEISSLSVSEIEMLDSEEPNEEGFCRMFLTGWKALTRLNRIGTPRFS